jgi:hypothetical protein
MIELGALTSGAGCQGLDLCGPLSLLYVTAQGNEKATAYGMSSASACNCSGDDLHYHANYSSGFICFERVAYGASLASLGGAGHEQTIVNFNVRDTRPTAGHCSDLPTEPAAEEAGRARPRARILLDACRCGWARKFRKPKSFPGDQRERNRFGNRPSVRLTLAAPSASAAACRGLTIFPTAGADFGISEKLLDKLDGGHLSSGVGCPRRSG